MYQVGLFGETGVDQGCETFECIRFVVAVSDEGDGHALDDAEGENAEKALCVDSAVVLWSS